jgi:multidrug resistance efflux pump
MKGKDNNSDIWRRRLFPILVWLIATAAVVGLFSRRAKQFEFIGIARTQTCSVAGTLAGRVKSIPVRMFDNVREGQILAVLDDELINAQIATAMAEIHRLIAELIPTQDQLLAEATQKETDWIAAQRRFSMDVEQCRARILELRTIIETDGVMLEELALEIRIVRELVEKDALAPYELQKVKIQYNILAKKIENNQHLLSQYERDFQQAQERRREFALRQPIHPSIDEALELIHKAIIVQEQLVEELRIQRRQMVLRSPIDGVVVQIRAATDQVDSGRPGQVDLRRPGEVVLAGEPILTIAESRPSEIIAYATEEYANQLREGTQVELMRNNWPRQIARSEVTYIGPTVEEMPIRLWQNPNLRQWGRPFLMKVPPELELTPGELVGIHIL